LGREGGMLWLFPKKYVDAEFSRKDYFYKQNARKTYSDARLSTMSFKFNMGRLIESV
jgi:hypothetical protein